MDITIVTTVISAATAVMVVSLTSYFTKIRDHESDWRKMKVERYREYILALSGNAVERATLETHARYSDAVNSLQLVASIQVLHAVKEFVAFTSSGDPASDKNRHDQLLTTLIQAMRADLQPYLQNEDEDVAFWLLGVPLPKIKGS